MKMRKYLLLLSLIGFLSICQAAKDPEKRTEKISKTLKFSSQTGNNLLILKNVNGSVSIEGYDGQEIIIEAEKTIQAKNTSNLHKGWNELNLVFQEESNRIYIYLDAPFIKVKKETDNLEYQIHNDNEAYWYQVNYVVKVPAQISLNVSTINQGDVDIENVEGEQINASNINGSVTLNGIKGNAQASTINGELKVDFVVVPTRDSKFNTINGDIDVSFPKSLSADISMKTMNGEFYTDFPEVTLQAGKVEKNKSDSGRGTEFRIDKKTGIRIGNGGISLDFNTLNGNIYIRKNN